MCLEILKKNLFSSFQIKFILHCMFLLRFNIQINSPFQNVDSNLNINIPFCFTSFHKIDSLMNAW